MELYSLTYVCLVIEYSYNSVRNGCKVAALFDNPVFYSLNSSVCGSEDRGDRLAVTRLDRELGFRTNVDADALKLYTDCNGDVVTLHTCDFSVELNGLAYVCLVVCYGYNAILNSSVSVTLVYNPLDLVIGCVCRVLSERYSCLITGLNGESLLLTVDSYFDTVKLYSNSVAEGIRGYRAAHCLEAYKSTCGEVVSYMKLSVSDVRVVSSLGYYPGDSLSACICGKKLVDGHSVALVTVKNTACLRGNSDRGDSSIYYYRDFLGEDSLVGYSYSLELNNCAECNTVLYGYYVIGNCNELLALAFKYPLVLAVCSVCGVKRYGKLCAVAGKQRY